MKITFNAKKPIAMKDTNVLLFKYNKTLKESVWKIFLKADKNKMNK